MNIPFYLIGGIVLLEAKAVEDLHHALGRRVRSDAGLAVAKRNADHQRVAAQVNVRVGRVERGSKFVRQLAAGNQVLDVDFVADGVLFGVVKARYL